VQATPEAVRLVQEQGGQLYVWAKRSRCCHGSLTFLETSSEPPPPVVACASCGGAVPADARFCAACGHVVAPEQRADAAAVERPQELLDALPPPASGPPGDQ
jgi:rRNA maturation endonuclease Nob1